MNNKILDKPNCPYFGSGPCTKPPGYDISKLNPTKRTHLSVPGKDKIHKLIHKSRNILGLPSDYLIGIVPASDTGAIELAFWNLLGPRDIDVFHSDRFGKRWYYDITEELKLKANNYCADYGDIPDLSMANPDNDIVFLLNGTTSGVCINNMDWISNERKGLTFCDTTSGIFCNHLDWTKLDIVTYSWQKALGGEAAHGMLILSPNAVKRLNEFNPDRPIPKIFRIKENGRLNESIYPNGTLNTPSMLCIEDHIYCLKWVEENNGVDGMIQRCDNNFNYIKDFVEKNNWIHFLAKSMDITSKISVCLKLDMDGEKLKNMKQYFEDENIAFDIYSYYSAPEGLRIWCGPTIESDDIKCLLNWIEWYFYHF